MLQWAATVGKDPGCPGGASLSSTGQYTVLFLSKVWLSSSRNSKQTLLYHCLHCIALHDILNAHSWNKNQVDHILQDTDLEHLCLPSDPEGLGCLPLCSALLLLLCHPRYLGSLQSHSHLDLLWSSSKLRRKVSACNNISAC